jgi:hypothetical protein
MQSTSPALALSALATLAGLAVGCNKAPSTGDAPAPAAAPAASVAAAAAASSTAAPAGAALAGLDACLVGSWKGTSFSLKTEQVTAEGGANLVLKIGAGGDSVIDFGPMSPVNAKSAGAGFDFQYSGKATATLSTPTRGNVVSDKADYSGLRVTVNVHLPGAGKLALLKDKPLSELSQMASGVIGGKAPTAAAPPGIDASPVFSSSRYTCEADTLTILGDKLAAQWLFTRDK